MPYILHSYAKVPVAQLVRVSDWYSEGPGFESQQGHVNFLSLTTHSVSISISFMFVCTIFMVHPCVKHSTHLMMHVSDQTCMVHEHAVCMTIGVI